MTTTITPAVGAGIALTQGGTGASPGYSAIDFRRLARATWREGVMAISAWKVSENSPQGMSVVIDADVDAAVVQGDSVTDQGMYYIPPHSSNITETIAAAHETNPRIDRVLLEAKDNAHDGSGANVGRTTILAGTATNGATLENQSGAAAIPNGALHLADVLVPAAATVISNTQIRDYRRYALREAPLGVVVPSARSLESPGWKFCDGSALNRKQYADLFAAIGTNYGAGDGTTTFNLPDLRGRVPAGVDGAAGRLTANDALGNSGGAEKHTLTIAEMPAHSHNVGSYDNGMDLIGIRRDIAGLPAIQVPTGSQGGGGAHNNMPPYQVVNYMIFIGSVV